MSERHSSAPFLIGASSLLVIIAVLCLTVFALLAASTARADQRLSEKAAKTVEDFYAADCAAEEILAQLRAGTLPVGVIEKNGIYTYSCAISNTQTLAVEVKITETEYTVLRWQAVSTSEWETDDSLHVWDGN